MDEHEMLSGAIQAVDAKWSQLRVMIVDKKYTNQSTREMKEIYQSLVDEIDATFRLKVSIQRCDEQRKGKP